jgi:hypothetical protein
VRYRSLRFAFYDFREALILNPTCPKSNRVILVSNPKRAKDGRHVGDLDPTRRPKPTQRSNYKTAQADSGFGSARPTFDRQDANFAKLIVDTIGTEDLLITTNGGF